MRGKWAQGIEPRHFHWILKDHLAVCERPGGYGDNHRRVRRQEEIIWLRQNGFDVVVSLIPGTHNLHNYDEHDLPFRHLPFAGPEEGPGALLEVLTAVRDLVGSGHRVVVHREELGERISGVVAAYLRWTGAVDSGPQAVSVTEQLLRRELGPTARELVALVDRLPACGDTPVRATAGPAAEGDDRGDDSAP